MTRFSFLFLLLFFSVLSEILINSLGGTLVLTAPILFYISYVYGPKWGIIAAVLCGAGFDFSFGMDHPWSIAGNLAVVALAVFWLHFVDSSSLFLLMIPGLMLPLPVLVLVPLLHCGFSALQFLDFLSVCLLTSLIWTVLLPLLIVGLDFLGSKLEFRTFDEAWTKYHVERSRS